MRLLIIILVIFSVSCVAQKENSKLSSPGTSRFDPNSGLPIRWPTAVIGGSLNVKISDDINADFVGADYDGSNRNLLEQMMKEWNNSTSDYDFFKLPAAYTTNKNYAGLASFHDGEMGIYKSYNWFTNVSASALAVTQFFGIRRNAGTTSEFLELIHSDVIVNYRDYDFSNDSTSTTDYDLPSVILHELGHFVGLSHTSDFGTPSVMLPYFGITDVQRQVTATDITNIRNNYNAGALTASKSFLIGNGLVSPSPKEGEQVQGIIELRADGECRHYINDELVHTH